MTKKEIAKLACKLLGLYALLMGLTTFGSNLGWLFGGLSSDRPVFGFLIPSVIFTAYGLFLWFGAAFLSGLMISDENNKEGKSKMVAAEMQAIAFSVLGLWILAQGLINAADYAMFLWLIDYLPWTGEEGFGGALREMKKGRIVLVLVKIGIGIWLLFGARGLVGIVNRMRGVGTKASTKTTE